MRSSQVAKIAGVRARERKEVARLYDGAHDLNELHRYGRRTGKQQGEVFHGGTLGEGMRDAISQVKAGYRTMIEGWRTR